MGRGKKEKKRGTKRTWKFFRNFKVNIWRLLTAAVFLFMFFLIGRTCIHIIRTYAEIHRLNTEKEFYLESIAADSMLLERLKYDDYLEQYARENFHMQRRNEHVYIIEE